MRVFVVVAHDAGDLADDFLGQLFLAFDAQHLFGRALRDQDQDAVADAGHVDLHVFGDLGVGQLQRDAQLREPVAARVGQVDDHAVQRQEGGGRFGVVFGCLGGVGLFRGGAVFAFLIGMALLHQEEGRAPTHQRQHHHPDDDEQQLLALGFRRCFGIGGGGGSGHGISPENRLWEGGAHRGWRWALEELLSATPGPVAPNSTGKAAYSRAP